MKQPKVLEASASLSIKTQTDATKPHHTTSRSSTFLLVYRSIDLRYYYSNYLELKFYMAQKCAHKGCERDFTDPEEDCHYHPGAPIFHEGQKGELPFSAKTAHTEDQIVS